MQDRLSDMITRIRNGYMAGKSQVVMPHTKLLESVARVMAAERYLGGVEVKEGKPSQLLVLTLLYSNTRPAVNKLKMISKPGVRIYQKTKSLKPVLSGLGIKILSTSEGVMTSRQAKSKQLGGEVLIELW